MEEGALVWSRDLTGDEAWLLCEVLKKTSDSLELQVKGKPDKFTRGLESSNEETGERKFDGVELANTPLSQEEKDEGHDNDLITLPHLHEPAILHALADRFFRGKIYTWTGPVLIAVNPFQRLPLYTTEILEAYRREGLLSAQGMQSGTDLEPHIFAVADRSYRQMMAESRRSQSILISGESGAGKTESTKIVMLYLTTLGAGSQSVEEPTEGGELSVMQRVLQSNPVLEAFGNARTLRNDNSSRFGKFIELGFSRSGHLMGAKVQTYLLEKVRLAFHAAGERNYHIFYQLLRGCKEEDHAKYEFHDGITGGLDLPNYFRYTGQGGAPHLREFTDEDGLQYTLKGMKKLGWSEERIQSVLSLVAGLLHLGQVTFDAVEKDGLETATVQDDKSLQYSARMLGVDQDQLRCALTERILLARGEEMKMQLTPEKAGDARDALSKTIYGALFLWIVEQVNASIGWENDSDIRSSCGVLDIFGFECFAINSFEQLCINYTNEALQQQFNQFIFKLEQAEYEAEQIAWAFIEFPDNQDCLDTIQEPKVGLLAILDDECRLPKGSDKNFAKRSYDRFLPNKGQTESDNTRFHASKIQQVKSLFCIRHFAGLVEYSVETNFMEKNKDEIPITAKKMFETAPSELIKDAYGAQVRDNQGRAPAATTGRAKQKTVGQQFKEQLNGLIENVQKTDPHYIRCIKPNDAAKPLLMTRKRTTEQLRYGGVLEAIRVARAGYPVRLQHEGFYQRYRMLLPATSETFLPLNLDGQKAQDLCVRLVDAVLEHGEKHAEAEASGPIDPKEEGISRAEKIRRMQAQPMPLKFPRTDVQLGKTKVFMRKHPHDCLEAHRVFQQSASVTLIQCWARGLAQQRKLYLKLGAAELIQRVYRGSKGRERWWRIKGEKSAKLLTNVFRMLIKWRAFNRSKRGTIRFQAIVRGHNVRREFAAKKVQQYHRRHVARRRFVALVSAVIALQCKTRERTAKKILGDMLKEQKDVGKLKENNERLKEEMASLRAMLAAQAKEDRANSAHEIALAEKQKQINELEKKISELEKELNAAKGLVEKLESNVESQQAELVKDKEQIKRLQTMRPPQIATRNKSGSLEEAHSPNTRRKKPNEGSATGSMPDNYVSPELLAEHRSKVARLEDALESERRIRREADGEVIKLRAKINGVDLSETELRDLLAQKLDSPSGLVSEESSYAGDETSNRLRSDEPAPELTGLEPNNSKDTEVQQALDKLGFSEHKEEAPKQNLFDQLRASADFIPLIRRGFGQDEAKEADDIMAVGWKVEIRNRKEREEALRDDVHRFEIKMKKYISILEEGLDVVMWQLNRGSPDNSAGEMTNEFALKSQNVTMKLHRRGDLFVQAMLNFMLRGGYLSKAMGRNRNVDKAALEPLSLHDILEVRAGCLGYDHVDLPTSSGKSSKSKSKKSSTKAENKQASLFMTIQATPTPLAATRSYIFRFKSRSARNDVLNGLRSVLADMQIHEGVSISGMHSSQPSAEDGGDEIMVPLTAVHEVINRERESYDRILLMLLQGAEDLKEKEDDLLRLRNKLEYVTNESKEKDRVQANDSKLIMQLSKKLENLLMDNEDLRDQNDRLNTRLVTVESESLNASGRG